MTEMFQPTYIIDDDGDIKPSYKPGNGNEPTYPKNPKIGSEDMPHDIYNPDDTVEPLPEQDTTETTLDDSRANKALPIDFASPADESHNEIYERGMAESRKIIDEARRKFNDGE